MEMMKKFLAICILFLVPYLCAASCYPYDRSIGQVVDPASSKNSTIIYEATGKAFDLAWLDTYVDEGVAKSIAATASTRLSEVLPLGVRLLSQPRPELVEVREIKRGIIISFTLSEEGRILSISFR